MPHLTLARHVLTKELRLTYVKKLERGSLFYCEKVSDFEVCPKCATPSKSIYDRRQVTVRDAPIRGKFVTLKIKKRRFWCRKCHKPFTEPISGIGKGMRTTHRFRKHVLWCRATFRIFHHRRRTSAPRQAIARRLGGSIRSFRKLAGRGSCIEAVRIQAEF